MKNCTHHTGLLTNIERLPSSPYGNPRYKCKIDGWTCQTAVDSNIAYKLRNYENRRVKAIIGTHYGKPTIAMIAPTTNEDQNRD